MRNYNCYNCGGTEAAHNEGCPAMNSNHSIDVEAERKLFEADMFRDGWALEFFQRHETPIIDVYESTLVEGRWQGWLAAKRSIPANTALTKKSSDQVDSISSDYLDILRDIFDSSDEEWLHSHLSVRHTGHRNFVIEVYDANWQDCDELFPGRYSGEPVGTTTPATTETPCKKN